MQTTHSATVKISANDRGNLPGKLGDAELQFQRRSARRIEADGFAIWERRNGSD